MARPFGAMGATLPQLLVPSSAHKGFFIRIDLWRNSGASAFPIFEERLIAGEPFRICVCMVTLSGYPHVSFSRLEDMHNKLAPNLRYA